MHLTLEEQVLHKEMEEGGKLYRSAFRVVLYRTHGTYTYQESGKSIIMVATLV